MNTFLLSFDATTSFSGGNPPTLEILVGGVVVSSVVMQSGATSYDVFVEYTGTAPSTLDLRFDGSSGDPGDTITFTAVSINDSALNLGTDLTATILMQAQTSGVTAANDLFGHVTPTLGATTISGTGSDDGALNGSDTDDTIDALAGNDWVRGRGGNDEINGGTGADYIFGEDGNDTILGGGGDDVLFGNDGDDILYGEADNDYLIGGDGSDLLNGGAGNDGILGDAGDDVIFGEDGDDYLIGDAGDDILIGDDGNDILVGGADNDALSGGDNDDQLIGGTGNDLLAGGAGADEIFGEDGADTASGGAGDDNIYGGDGNDELDGGDDNDSISGGDGDDIIDGDAGTDTLIGGAGADTMSGGAGADVLHGHGLDADAISTILSANPNVTYSEDTGSFYQFVNANVNYATAQAAATANTLSGVAGHLLTVTTAAENTFVANITTDNSWTSGQDVAQDGTWQWNAGPESGVQFSSQTPTAVNNMHVSWAGGQPQTNTEYNTIFYTDGTWHDWVDTSTHSYIIEWEGGQFSDDNAIDTIDGGSGNDQIYGWGGDDILSGGADNDNLFGGAGADTLNGDGGTDTLVGGAGADIIDGGDGNDNIILVNGDFAAGESITGGNNTDTITLGNATTVDFSTGTLATVENLNGSGNDDNVTMSALQFVDFTTIDLGGGSADVLNMQATGTEDISALGLPTVSNVETGNLTGSTGNDNLTITGAQIDSIVTATGTIDFDTGTDILNITSTSADLNTLGATDGSVSGLETISASSAGAAVTIDMSGQTENFTLLEGGGSGDTITGGDGNDTLTGNGGADTLAGGGGDDILNGGNGDDVIYGADNNGVATPSVDNNALQFDGANDSISLSGLNNNTSNGSTVTVEFWMEWDGTANSMPFSFQQASGTQHYNLWFDGTRFGFNSWANNIFGISSAGLANTLVHVAAVFTDNDISANQLYIDGVAQSLSFVRGGDSDTNAQLTTTGQISGVTSTNTYDFDGVLDEVRIWNGTRTSTEINDNMDVRLTGSETNLVAYYDFENISNGAGGITDEGPNGDDGTLNGTTVATASVTRNDIISSGGYTGDGDTSETNTINGGAGADTIYGSVGTDTLNGGADDDTIYSGSDSTNWDAAVAAVLAANAGVVYSAATNSFYQVVASTVDWDVANAAANVATLTGYTGVTGHLATITSQAEQDFLEAQVGGNSAWLGGGDFGTEGVWRWTAGPEAGVQFANSTGGQIGSWYNSWAGGQPNDSDGTQDYLYMLNGTDWADLVIEGDGSTGFVTVPRYIIEWEADTLITTVESTTIDGGSGDDTLYANDGIDTFVYDSATWSGSGDVDTIENFDTASRDAIDISDLLTGYTYTTSDITDFVQLTEASGNTTIAVDANGTTGGTNFVDVATLNGVTGLDLYQMIAADNLIV